MGSGYHASETGAPRSAVTSGKSRLKIAPFGFSNTRGMTPSYAASIADLNWAEQVRIARLSEAVGFEAVIAGQRWRGYAGGSQWCREQYDTLTWAAGIGALTERITVFSTVHIPLVHPVRLAKELATIDHITNGRCALNIVAGWNSAEFDMFDITQREHDDRYGEATEWTRLLKQLWSEDKELDYNGRFLRGKAAYSAPRPLQEPYPPIMSAGSSPAGRQFAATEADICFAAAADYEGLREAATDIRRRAAEAGRSVQVWTALTILCGETEADARRQYEHYVTENGDFEAANDAITGQIKGGARTIDPEVLRTMQERRIYGSFGPSLMGSPEMVVDAMGRLGEAGIDGIGAVWFDFERGIEAFRDLVLPLAVDSGLRTPAPVPHRSAVA